MKPARFIVALAVALGATVAQAAVEVRLDCDSEAPLTADYASTAVYQQNFARRFDFLPACDGLVLATGFNAVDVINVATLEVVRSFPLGESPFRLVRIPGTTLVFANSGGTSASRIDVATGQVTPFIVGAGQRDLIAGEPGEVWFMKNYPSQLARFDVRTLQPLGSVVTLQDADFIQYDPRSRTLFTGNSCCSPARLSRFWYAPHGALTHAQTVHEGASGQALVLSPNSRHLAFPAGGGNGVAYTIYDYNPNNLTQNYGYWDTGAYPQWAAFRFDSKKILACNGTVSLFDVASHALERTWNIPCSDSARTRWSPTGRNHFTPVDFGSPFGAGFAYGSLPTLPALRVAKTGTGVGYVSSDIGAITCGDQCLDSFATTDTVWLAATALPGSSFHGWSGCDLEAGGQCAVFMNSARSVTASFKRNVAGDLDFDGHGDLVFQHADGRVAAWTMNGTSVTGTANLIGAGSGWRVAHVADLDGNGKADILFTHLDGRTYAYVMNGLTVVGGKELLPAALGWSVSHTADLNGDGKADLILRHDDGRAHLWLMDGTTIIGSASLLPAASGWNVVATGDLNGDRKADIAFMHDEGNAYAYIMDGTTVTAGVGFLSPGSGWTVTHMADLDGDGKDDLFFRHADGRAHVFQMNGTSFGAGAELLAAGTGWMVSHLGDLNGDGKADLVFRHDDGRAHVRLMVGTVVTGAADVLPAFAGWSVSHLRDLNGDGKADLVFRHVDGRITARLMNGLAILGSAEILGAGGWSVAPGDARNGEYKMLATDAGEYRLRLDFNAAQYSVVAAGAPVASGTFSSPIDGTYTFAPSGAAPVRNNARFRVSRGVIVGAHPVGGTEAVPFVAANRFVTSAAGLPATNMWMFSRDMIPTEAPNPNSRIIAIRLAGNQVTYCPVAAGALTTVANCLPENLETHELTFNADGSVTWDDAGTPVNLNIIRAEGELLMVRAQSYANGRKRFQIALDDSAARVAGTWEGGISNGSWGTASFGVTSIAFQQFAFTSSGATDNTGGLFQNPGAGTAPLRLFVGNEGVPYFVQTTNRFEVHIAARDSAKAGQVAFGLRR